MGQWGLRVTGDTGGTGGTEGGGCARSEGGARGPAGAVPQGLGLGREEGSSSLDFRELCGPDRRVFVPPWI